MRTDGVVYMEEAKENNAGLKVKGRFVKAYYYFNGCKMYFEKYYPSFMNPYVNRRVLTAKDVMERYLRLKKKGLVNGLVRLF